MTTQRTIRHRWRWLSIVAIANLLAVGVAAAPSQAWSASLCNGTAEGIRISGDLVVPTGASCSLIDSTVTGDVLVGTDASLSLDASTVRGDLTVRTGGFVAAIGSGVRGRTTLREAFGASVEDSELRGRVDVRDSGFFFSDGTTHRSHVSSRAGQTVILSGRVSGHVRTDQDLLTDLRDTVITGRLSVRGAALGSVVCRSEIDGEVELRDSGDLIQLGDSAPVADCEFNVFGDDLEIRDNLAEVRVSDNVIRDDLVCTGNQVTPTGADNRLRGEAVGQCADLMPAEAAAGPALRGSAAADSRTAESRIAELRRQIETRSAAAAAAAAEAGPATL
jgi:hypothetical protein